MRSLGFAHEETVMQAAGQLGDGYPSLFPGFSPTCPSLRRDELERTLGTSLMVTFFSPECLFLSERFITCVNV